MPRCFVFISQYASICGPIVEGYQCSRADLPLDCNDIKNIKWICWSEYLYTSFCQQIFFYNALYWRNAKLRTIMIHCQEKKIIKFESDQIIFVCNWELILKPFTWYMCNLLIIVVCISDKILPAIIIYKKKIKRERFPTFKKSFTKLCVFKNSHSTFRTNIFHYRYILIIWNHLDPTHTKTETDLLYW